jgi:hypothetical protein
MAAGRADNAAECPDTGGAESRQLDALPQDCASAAIRRSRCAAASRRTGGNVSGKPLEVYE